MATPLPKEGQWSDWQVRTLAVNFGSKQPKRDWFNVDEHYAISHKSWSHLVAKTLYELKLEERQLIIFMYHLSLEHIGIQTFDPTEKGLLSDYEPQESRAPTQEIL